MHALAFSRALRSTTHSALVLRSPLATITYPHTRLASTASTTDSVSTDVPSVSTLTSLRDLHAAATQFAQVRGVGRTTALEWATAGCFTLEDVLARDSSAGSNISLSEYQRGNVTEWAEYLSRVAASELGEFERRAQGLAERTEGELEASVSAIASGGSYMSYKVELALSHPAATGTEAASLLAAFVQNLREAGMVDDKWAVHTSETGLVWDGFVELPGRGANIRQLSINIR